MERELKGSPKETNMKMILLIFLIHFTGDFYGSFVNPLLPAFVEKFSLNLTQVGILAAIGRILSFVIQPPVGYVADHYRTRFFVVGGPLFSILFLPLAGIAPNFPVLFLLIALGSMGSSMYHPTAAGMVSTYSGPRFAFSMALYNFGGTFAFGCGPIFITYVVSRYGLSASPYTAALGLIIMALIFRKVPLPGQEGLKNFGFLGSLREVFGDVWKGVALIWVLAVFRTFVGQSFQTFIPVLFSREGHSLLSVGLIVSLFNVGGALGGLLAGILADRMGYKPVLYMAFGLSVPALYLLLFVPKGVYPFSFLSGCFIMSALPLFVAMAQEMAPRGKSMASSLMIGLAYGTGGMMTPITGRLADHFSIRPVLSVMAMLPLLMMALVYFMPAGKSSR